MKKYRVYAIASASKYVGEVEAETVEEAKEKAWEMESCQLDSLCWSCSDSLDLGDIYELQVEEEGGEA